MMIIEMKHFYINWEKGLYKIRKYKFRHRKKVKSVYLQILNLEIGMWYGDTSKETAR